MRIVLALVGVILATAFLAFMSASLDALPLYVVCGIGVALMFVGFWQDEVRDRDGQASGR